MSSSLLLAAILIPLLGGLLLLFSKDRLPGGPGLGAMVLTTLTSLLTWGLILTCDESVVPLLRFTDSLILQLRFDGMGRFFAGILATLWPLTVLYSLSYMEGKPRLPSFYGFFTMSYAVSLGISMAGNLFTMYCFYELLTLETMPLVMYPMHRKAVRAARTYLIFSLGGAAFAFASMLYLISVGAGRAFTLGGAFAGLPVENPTLTRVFFVLGFFGFGVKAAVFPVYRWLPKAAVAPTPVTALLHAVAVVKAGAFAVMRLSWYCYDPSLIRGTWAQTVPLLFAAFTLVFGSIVAVRQGHFKLRLAYSTVSNLSYILFGALLLTPEGLSAGLIHMAAHAAIKILAFFCAGAVLHQTGLEYNCQMNGLGKKMPVTFACFTISALALTGLPLFNGFISKWYLLRAAADAGTWSAYVGAGALLLSALLTAIYMFTIVCRAWFPGRDTESYLPKNVIEADWRMNVPHLIFSAACIVFGCWAQPIVNAASEIAGLIP